jgi:hypothetical protein
VKKVIFALFLTSCAPQKAALIKCTLLSGCEITGYFTKVNCDNLSKDMNEKSNRFVEFSCTSVK